jgi:ubiquinone/menaquinone biosynthesis C-methylase UbiE
MKAFEHISYARHVEHLDSYLDGEHAKRAAAWFDETTADYWRHSRMYECAEILKVHPDASWVTIGDGRFGLDSIHLRKKGLLNVFPTDISGHLLNISKERGHIDRYGVENAERLTFADRTYDYVLCKESFHHFPRPYVALYEMLRVARRAVFLIEPNDESIERPLTAPLSRAMLRSLPLAVLNRVRGKEAIVRIGEKHTSGKLVQQPVWEESGNFAYRFSRNEAEKVSLGLNLPQLVTKGLNDHYVDGCEFEPADVQKSDIFRTIVESIQKKDARCIEGLRPYNLLMVGFFLEPMDVEIRSKFLERGWEVLNLPRNPYLTMSS